MTSTSSERGWANLEHPEIYADIRAAGSLAGALRQHVAELGLDVGDIYPDGDVALLTAELGEAPELQRRPIAVASAALVCSFAVSGWSRGVYMISGGTSDLQEVARLAAAWRSGTVLADIQRVFPWMEISELAFAHERGPADAVAVQWSQVRAQMGDEQFDLGIRLVEAAYAEPRLRQLYPYTSHWVLCFSRCTGYPFTNDVPWIGYVVSEDRYQVRTHGWSGDHHVLGEPATAEEAVALLVANLPEGTGAAVEGSADEL